VNLTLNPDWLEPDFQPESLTDSPFGQDLPARPAWGTMPEVTDYEPWNGSLESFAQALVAVLRDGLTHLKGKNVDLAVSGGYDSRIMLALAEDIGLEVRCCGDGTQDPAATKTIDYLGVPKSRRYVHDLERSDPYGVVTEVEGWAPLYFGMSFFSPSPTRVLVTGLGGGEWFSYPAAGWHNGHKARTPRKTLKDWWLDTWPQYWLIPRSWGEGYATSFHPYCTPEYASVATRARDEWLVETRPEIELDAIREAMQLFIDPNLIELGYAPHRYDWKLSSEQEEFIDDRFGSSWLARTFGLDGNPSKMHHDVHACTLGGFATWCDTLIAEGHVLS
jgi:hypothetical protein